MKLKNPSRLRLALVAAVAVFILLLGGSALRPQPVSSEINLYFGPYNVTVQTPWSALFRGQSLVLKPASEESGSKGAITNAVVLTLFVLDRVGQPGFALPQNIDGCHILAAQHFSGKIFVMIGGGVHGRWLLSYDVKRQVIYHADNTEVLNTLTLVSVAPANDLTMAPAKSEWVVVVFQDQTVQLRSGTTIWASASPCADWRTFKDSTLKLSNGLRSLPLLKWLADFANRELTDEQLRLQGLAVFTEP